jgi:DNA polymerase III alpha subunit
VTAATNRQALRDTAKRFGVSQRQVSRVAKKHRPQITLALDALSASLTFMGITEKPDTDAVLKTVLKIVERNALKVKS